MTETDHRHAVEFTAALGSPGVPADEVTVTVRYTDPVAAMRTLMEMAEPDARGHETFAALRYGARDGA